MSRTQETTKEEIEFVPEEVTEIALNAIEKVLGENPYNENRTSQWTTSIIEKVLTDLTRLKKPYKYVVNCCLQQKTGAGLQISTASRWDVNSDGACAVKWENDYIHCCLHVFGMQI